MSEKQKNTDPVPLTAEEAQAMIEIPFEIIWDQKGNASFEVPFANIKEKARYVVQKYHLAADDLCVMKKQLVIRKNGKLKYANEQGLRCTKVNVVESNLKEGYFIVKAQVFFKDIETPFEDLGLCEKSEPGREYQTNATILETASTRAILRAISIHLPMSVQDMPTEEQISTDIEQKYNAEQNKIAEKKLQEQEKMKEIKITQADEQKYSNTQSNYNRKVKETKKAVKADKAIDDLLAVHSDDYSEPPAGVMDDE